MPLISRTEVGSAAEDSMSPSRSPDSAIGDGGTSSVSDGPGPADEDSSSSSFSGAVPRSSSVDTDDEWRFIGARATCTCSLPDHTSCWYCRFPR